MRKPKTLEQQFPLLTRIPKKIKDFDRKMELARAYQTARIIRYIIDGEHKLETRDNFNSEDWKPGKLRDFLKFATHLSVGDDPRFSGFNDYLRWWRIKPKTPKKQ